jgi:hypothetical protein
MKKNIKNKKVAKRDRRFIVRMSGDEEQEIQSRADLLEMTKSDYVRYVCFSSNINDLQQVIAIERERAGKVIEINRALANIARALSIVNVYADELLRRDMKEFREKLTNARELLLKLLKDNCD